MFLRTFKLTTDVETFEGFSFHSTDLVIFNYSFEHYFNLELISFGPTVENWV